LRALHVAVTYGRYAEAMRLVERSLALAWNPMQAITWRTMAGTFRLALGDLDGAEAEARWALDQPRAVRGAHPDLEGGPTTLLAEVLFERGDVPAALRLVAPETEGGRSFGGLLVRGEIALADGDAVSARGCAEAALAVGGRAGTVADRADLRASRALVLRARVLAARSILTEGGGAAASWLADVLEEAAGQRLVPSLLEAAAAALPLLDEGEGAEARAWVAAHPAARFAVRRRAGATAAAFASVTTTSESWRADADRARRLAALLRTRA
jgi:hypothetical protein